ncbi:1298_t:CDS:2, partial [Cetraspora pellucida]
LDEFNLTAKALVLTTDNASLMISCGALITAELEKEFNNLNFAHYRCFAHILNLVVIKGIELVDPSIEKIRSLMSYIKSSQPISDDLKCLCKAKNLKYLAPELDVKTRWNSVYYIKEDCININDTILFLKLFEHATCYLSASQYLTHGAVRFIFLEIQEHLIRYSNIERFTQPKMANAIYKKLKEYWPIMDKASQVSSLLDPSVKLSAFSNEIEKNQ